MIQDSHPGIGINLEEPKYFNYPPRLHKSRVIVLENLVEPHEVDELLRDEVKRECETFGEVLNCILHTVSGRESQ